MDRLAARISSDGGATRVAFYADSDAWPGGAETWLTRLMFGLRSSSWDVSLFLTAKPATDAWAAFLTGKGMTVTRVRTMREVDRAARQEAARLLRGFELVHVNKPHPRACLPAIAGARRAGARVVVSSEHVVVPPASRYPLGRRVVRHLVRSANHLCDAVTVPSDASRQAYLDAYGCSPSKVVTVRGAVDLETFKRPVDASRVRKGLGLADDQIVAAVVGRLHTGKGIEHAVRATEILLKDEPAFRLLVVGGGPYEERLRGLTRECGVDAAVIFAGPRDDVPAILAAVDVVVVPSESETAGLAALEGMAARRPVVATRVGGLPEAIDDGVTGLLVPPNDPRALADAIRIVLSSPERAEQMGVAGRLRVEAAYGTDSLVSTVEALYERLLRTARG